MNDEKMRRFHYLSQKYEEYGKPLYLSYPVEGNWKCTGDKSCMPESLARAEEADLYVHLPFCREMCYFCCCDKITTQKEETKEIYLDGIQKELKLKFGDLKGKKCSSMHWGGGTPTYLKEKQLEKLYGIIEPYFVQSEGSIINIEAYPDKDFVTREKLVLLKQLGFQSISIGIQDFDKRVQKAIHRDTSSEEVIAIAEEARIAGLKIHIDLCYGLPFQGLNEFEKTIKIVKEIEPDQIVIYPYAHYPFLYPLQRKIPYYSIPNAFIKLLLIHMADEMLAENYKKFGIDTYVKRSSPLEAEWKSDKVVRNFMGTNINSNNPLVGIGMAAVSRYQGRYQKNSSKLKNYQERLLAEEIPVERECILTSEDKLRYFIIQDEILGKMKISKKRIEEYGGIIFETKFEKEMKRLYEFESDGLITGVTEDVIALTEDGVYFARCIAHIFNKYYN